MPVLLCAVPVPPALQVKKRKSLQWALHAVKTELLYVGIISLLLSAFQVRTARPNYEHHACWSLERLPAMKRRGGRPSASGASPHTYPMLRKGRRKFDTPSLSTDPNPKDSASFPS